jgi:integrase
MVQLATRFQAEAMANRRHQTPSLERYGKWWTIRVRVDDFVDGQPVRVKKRVRLALIETTTERKALKLRDEYMQPLNASFTGVGSATSFHDFVHGTYLRCDFVNLAKSSQDRTKGILKNYLLPAFGKMMLRDITPAVAQQYYSLFANSELSRESVDKIRDTQAAILQLAAVKYRLIPSSPMEHIDLPRTKNRRKPQRAYITPEQFDRLVRNMPEPYATMVYVAIYTGLRVSELIGLKWGDLSHDTITVDERYCRGDWAEPKSDASAATIGVDREVIERMHKLKILTVSVKAGTGTRKYKLVKKDGADDLVFQSVKDGKPMRDNNILSRFIKPAGRKLGFGFVNWRTLRTSRATWMVEAGANVKDVQGQMRHSKVQTTLDIYAQFVQPSARRAIEQTRAAAEMRIAAARSIEPVN